MRLRDQLLNGTFGFCYSGVEGGGGSGGGGAAPASSPVTEPVHEPTKVNEPDFESKFEEMFRFDPFAKPEKAAEAPVVAAPQAAVPTSAAPTTPSAASAAPNPVPASAPTAQSPGEAALAAAAHSLQTVTANLNKPAPGPVAEEAEDPMLNYMYDVPPQVAQALTSEDPNIRIRAQNAMHAVFARAVHTRVRQDFAKVVKEEIPRLVQQHFEQYNKRQQIRTDFYGKYPELDNPDLTPVVANITARVMAQPGNGAWSPQLADAIAAEVFKIIPGLRKVAPTAQNGNLPAPQPAPVAQPHMFNGGSRPAANGSGLTDEITQTLFGDFQRH